MLAGNATRQQRPQNESPANLENSIAYLGGLLLADLGVPLLFALSVRWTRSVMRKWKALRLPPAAEPAP